jgi:hypothetical protein
MVLGRRHPAIALIQPKLATTENLGLGFFLALQVFALCQNSLVQLCADRIRQFEQLIVSVDLNGLAGSVHRHVAVAAASHVLFQFGAESGRRFCVKIIG